MNSTISPIYEVSLALDYVDQFKSLTTLEPLANSGSYESSVLRCKDLDQLGGLLANLAQKLAGSDWLIEDDDFLQDCLDAEIDYEELLKIPLATERSVVDLERKEIGDLGELLALLVVLSYTDHDPTQVFPKNALKLYERLSEPGIDVLAFSLDLSLEGSHPLEPSELAQAFESKGSKTKSFNALAKDASASLLAIDLHKWQRELRLVRASLEERGAGRSARRVKEFLIVFGKGSLVRSGAVLMGEDSPPDPLDSKNLDACHETLPLSVFLVPVHMNSLRTRTFAFRQ